MSDHKPVNGDNLVYVSASSMQKADPGEGCTRQWYYRYKLGLPDKPPGIGIKRGLEGHRRLEHYFKTGDNVLDPLERLGIERGLLPEVGPGLLLEQSLQEPELLADGVPVRGSIDLLNIRDPSVIEITDYKFKKDVSMYGASADDLINPHKAAGIQMLTYASWARWRFPGVKRVRLRHLSFQTQGRKDVVEVVAESTLTALADSWSIGVAKRIVPAMREAARAPKAHDVPANYDVCGKYGGCAYKEVCLDRMARIVAGFKKQGESQMGMLSKVTSTSTATPPAAVVGVGPIQVESSTPPGLVTAPAVPASTPPALASTESSTPASTVTAPVPPKKMQIVSIPDGGLEAKDAVPGQVYSVRGVRCTYLCMTGYTGRPEVYSFAPAAGGLPLLIDGTEIISTQDAPPMVTPPDVPKSDPAIASKAKTIAEVTGAAPTAPAVPVAPAGEIQEKAKKRARRTNAQIQADDAAAAGVIPAGRPLPPAPAPAPVVAPEVRIAPGVTMIVAPAVTAPTPEPVVLAEGFSLYFVGSPIGKATRTLNEYVEKLDRSFCETAQLNCPDIRANDSKEFGFGKWKAYMAKLALEELPPPGHYIVTPGGDERVDVVANALMSLAELVVR